MQLAELSYLYPEIWLLSITCVTLIAGLYIKRSKAVVYAGAQSALLGVILFASLQMGEGSFTLFGNHFVMDSFSAALKCAIAAMSLVVFWYSKKMIFERASYPMEYYILGLFSILGMMTLISANSLLTLYLGIELFALPLYALIPIFKGNSAAPEAAMKYFVMGALASGLLLYGVSLLYGVTGSFEMHTVSEQLALKASSHPAAWVGLVFVIVALAFKFGAVPFHAWLPDVYQGSPISVTLFLGTLPKLAAFGFAIRLLGDTFSALQAQWAPLLTIMAVLSLLIGNIAAIAQTNLKRMLGYSTIAHMGFLLMGLLVGPGDGFSAAFNYITLYVVMALGLFGIMTALSRPEGEAQNIEDFRGLGARHPWIAFLMMILLFSLAGIPPFAGFYAKLFVLNAVIGSGHIVLAVVAVLSTVIGAFYYLRMVRVLFFDPPLEPAPIYSAIGRANTVVLSLNGLAVLALGIFSNPLLNLCGAILAKWE